MVTSEGSRPKTVRYSFLAFVFSFPFEFLYLPYVTGNHFSLANLTGLLFFAFYAFHLGLPFKKSLPKVPPAIGWFLGYPFAYVLGGLLINEGFAHVYSMRFTTIIQLLVFLWCASDLLRDQRLTKSCLLAFSGAAVVLAIGTLLNLPGFVPEIRTRTRPLGMNPNRVAALMASAAIILIGLYLNESHWSRQQKWSVVILVLPLLAVLVNTGSRAGVGGFIIGVMVFVLTRGGLKRKTTAILLSLLGAAVVLFLVAGDPLAAHRWERFFQEGHTTGRDIIFRAALEMIHERPVFGWGHGAFWELGFRAGRGGILDAHNFLLYLLLEVGFVGAVPFLIALSLCLRAAWKTRTGPLGILPLALLLSSLAMMMTHTALTFKIFWLFLALALAAAAQKPLQVRVDTVSNSHFLLKHRRTASRHLTPQSTRGY